MIAEPGRFLAQACLTLVTRIIGLSYADKEREKVRYYLSDGVYGSFNNLIYDHAACGKPLPLRAGKQEAEEVCGGGMAFDSLTNGSVTRGVRKKISQAL